MSHFDFRIIKLIFWRQTFDLRVSLPLSEKDSKPELIRNNQIGNQTLRYEPLMDYKLTRGIIININSLIINVNNKNIQAQTQGDKAMSSNINL